MKNLLMLLSFLAFISCVKKTINNVYYGYDVIHQTDTSSFGGKWSSDANDKNVCTGTNEIIFGYNNADDTVVIKGMGYHALRDRLGGDHSTAVGHKPFPDKKINKTGYTKGIGHQALKDSSVKSHVISFGKGYFGKEIKIGVTKADTSIKTIFLGHPLRRATRYHNFGFGRAAKKSIMAKDTIKKGE